MSMFLGDEKTHVGFQKPVFKTVWTSLLVVTFLTHLLAQLAFGRHGMEALVPSTGR